MIPTHDDLETTRSVVTARSAMATRGLGLACVVALAAVPACDAPGGDRTFMSIGTGGTGGVYYVLGGALASQLSQSDPDRRYTAEVTGASVENVNRIRNGQLDLGITMAVTAFEAYSGGQDYEEPFESLRALAPLYPNITHVMIGRDVDIETIADLEGRVVSVGSAGSGTEQLSRQLLAAVGLTYDDIEARYLSFTESASALQDGAIDAAILSVGYPAAAVLEATTTGGARLLPLDEQVIQALQERYPYYAESEIPPGVYRGMSEAIPTVSVMNWIVAREDLPGEVVDHLLDILSEEREALIQVHEMARQIDLNTISNAPIPVHPAAAAWLERANP